MEKKRKRHKFLIFFSLWLNAACRLFLSAAGVAAYVDPSGRYRFHFNLSAAILTVGVALLAVGYIAFIRVSS